MDPSQVVAPDLFDAIAQPDVLLPLVMANAMSPRLWRLTRRVDDAPDPREAARAAVDRAFTHASPEQMARLSGYLDLDAERARLGAEVVDRAIREIDRACDERRRRGMAGDLDELQQVIAQRRFPAYTYANIDVIRAARRAGSGASERPRGLTSCVDETALFSAAIMTAPRATADLDGVAILASSAHSTVFGWSANDSWWYWSKRSLFTRQSFRAQVEQQHGGDPADAMVQVMAAPTRRIISRRGHVDLDARTSSLPPDEVRRTLDAVQHFFGVLPPGLDGALDGLRYVAPSPFDVLAEEALACTSAEAVQSMVRRHATAGGATAPAAVQALLAFRSLEVPDLMPYMHAARRGPLAARLAATLGSADQAVAAVADLGAEPALGDPARLALPDEVLGRGSASPAERALLLHVLLERVTGQAVRTIIHGDDAITRVDQVAVRASDLAQVRADAVEPDGPALRHAAPPGQQ